MGPALFVAAGVAFAACGGGGHGALHHPAKTTTSLAPTTTGSTATVPGAPTYPLTGLAVSGAHRVARPALIVKVDNAPRARPQAGLIEADIVIEEQVEGGVTRFAAVFQSTDASAVGPVRSARSTDIAVVSEFNRPLFAYSGANARFLQLVRAAPLVDVGVDAATAAYGRDPKRPSPYNLFTSTAALFARAPKTAGPPPPPPQFAFRPAGQPPAGAGVAKVVHIGLKFPGTFGPNVTYDWDAPSGTWRRGEDGSAHLDSAGRQFAPRNVVVQFITYTPTGLVDQAGAPVFQGELVGAGEAWIFTGGMLVKGHWSRPTAAAVTTYTDAAGAPIQLTPGQTWVELPATGTAVASS